jgi:hypothetical protein
LGEGLRRRRAPGYQLCQEKQVSGKNVHLLHQTEVDKWDEVKKSRSRRRKLRVIRGDLRSREEGIDCGRLDQQDIWMEKYNTTLIIFVVDMYKV